MFVFTVWTSNSTLDSLYSRKQANALNPRSVATLSIQ